MKGQLWRTCGLGLGLGVVALCYAQPEGIQQASQGIEETRKKIQTLSFRFIRTLPHGSGTGMSVVNSKGDRRYDLSSLNSKGGYRESLYFIRGEGFRYRYFGEPEPSIFSVDINIRKGVTANPLGSIQGGYEVLSEGTDLRFSHLLKKARVTADDGETLTAVAPLPSGGEVEFRLVKSFGWFCDRWTTKSKGRTVKYEMQDWVQVGAIKLPTRTTWIETDVNEPEYRYSDEIKDIKLNEPVDDLLKLPVIPEGVTVEDETKQLHYTMGPGGKLIPQKRSSGGPVSSATIAFASFFMLFATLAIFTVVKRTGSRSS